MLSLFYLYEFISKMFGHPDIYRKLYFFIAPRSLTILRHFQIIVFNVLFDKQY